MDFSKFISVSCGSPSPECSGFTDGDETLHRDRGFCTRDDGALIGWTRSSGFDIAKGKIIVMASHTDSPCLKVRPHSKMDSEKCDLLGVECYGGGLWHTWFDRGLGVCGQVTLHQDNKYENRLVNISSPIACIPNLCIHLQTAEERQAFKINKELHLRPILQTASTKTAPSAPTSVEAPYQFAPALLEAVCTHLNVPSENVVSWDLCIADAAPAVYGGIKQEFIHAAGLDNKTSMFANFSSLVQTAPPDNTLVVAIAFNHEEVGSQTSAGADSTMLHEFLDILMHEGLEKPSLLQRRAILTRSVVLSCDAAHAVHPNYAEKHQAQHKPHLGEGVVVKVNANQRYATTPALLGFARNHARMQSVKTQEVVVRNDSPCGSTVGPMTAASTGIATLDCGVPLWAMHSIRETCTWSDVESLVGFANMFITMWSPAVPATY